MNHTEAAQYIKATLTAFGPGEAISMTKETWAKIHEAMQVLAQPEQKPVALEDVYLTIIQWDVGGGKRSRRELARRIVDLYTTPPSNSMNSIKSSNTLDAQRKPLTDEEIEAIHQSTWMQSTATLNDFARAIEAAHGIKE